MGNAYDYRLLARVRAHATIELYWIIDEQQITLQSIDTWQWIFWLWIESIKDDFIFTSRLALAQPTPRMILERAMLFPTNNPIFFYWSIGRSNNIVGTVF